MMFDSFIALSNMFLLYPSRKLLILRLQKSHRIGGYRELSRESSNADW